MPTHREMELALDMRDTLAKTLGTDRWSEERANTIAEKQLRKGLIDLGALEEETYARLEEKRVRAAQRAAAKEEPDATLEDEIGPPVDELDARHA